MIDAQRGGSGREGVRVDHPSERGQTERQSGKG